MLFIDVGCLSVGGDYVLLPLVNIEADLANSQVAYARWEIQSDTRRKRVEWKRLQQLQEK